MEFKNLKELEKWLVKNQGNLIQSGHVTNKNGVQVNSKDIVKYAGGVNLSALREHARKLEYYLNDEIEIFYTMYRPSVYERTYAFLNSVVVNEPQVEPDGRVSIEITFDKDLATHDSIFNGEDGFVPILLNEGWQWSGSIGNTGPYRLARYVPQSHNRKFVENAIERYISEERPDPKIIEILKAVTLNGQPPKLERMN